MSILTSFLKIWSFKSNSVTRQLNFNRTRIGEKCQIKKKKKIEIPDNFTERKNKETTHQTFLGVARNFVFLRSEWMKNFWKHLERIIFVEIFNNNWTTPDTKRKRTLKKWRKIFQFSFHLAYSKLFDLWWFTRKQ